MQETETGLRYDIGKLRYDLLPPDAIAELVAVFTKGAEKYAPRNWEKGMNWQRCYASLHRHASAWQMGEDRDPETGCLHMAHVAWNALAIVAYQLRGVGEDNRPSLARPVSVSRPPKEVSEDLPDFPPDYPRYDGDIGEAARQIWSFFNKGNTRKGAHLKEEYELPVEPPKKAK